MKKLFINLFKIISVLLILFIIFAVWYQQKYSMDEARSFEVNTPESSKHLLIATQGSLFKDSIVSGLVDQFKEDDLYIRVIDVKNLEKVEASQWDAVCLIHTWEYYKAPSVVKEFIEKSSANMDRVVVYTSSGDGRYKMEEVDAITGASILENVPEITRQLAERLKKTIWNF